MVFPPKPDLHATRATLLVRLRPESPERELAWREFYEIYGTIIGGFARRMGVPPHEIGDVVQDVMTGFYGVTPNFVYDPARGRFRGYLKTCTWRAIQRRLGRRIQLSGRAVEEIADDEPSVEQKWDDVWQQEKLHRAVEAVRQKYLARSDSARTFQAFEMFALLDQPAEAIAAELEMSVNGVHQAKSRVSRAIKAAMDAMEEDTG
jgi:RNA polymerase sigma factor (sigma-70 family)